MAKPSISKTSQQDEFHVELSKVFEALVDADEVQEGDKWSYVDGGSGTLIIVRKREVITDMKRKRAEEREALALIGVHVDEEAEE